MRILCIEGPSAVGKTTTAAALAAAEGVPPRRVPIEWLQETLVERGAYLGERVTRRVQARAAQRE